MNGIDLSNYQGPISLAEAQGLKTAGVDFCYVLLTDGVDYKNPDAPGQCAALRSAGIYVGMYHFLRPTATNADQILDFITMAHACGGTTLPLALDSETPDANGWADLATRMYSFARQIEGVNDDVVNTRSILYCNLDFYANLAPQGFPWGRWVWLADPSHATPSKPCMLWQQAPRPVGQLPNVDFDVFRGAQADWLEFVGAAPAPTPAPPPNAVPGPNGIELSVIGFVNPAGVYPGPQVSGGVPVYAGTGNPTVFHTGFVMSQLPAGTPIAVALTDLSHVG